MMFVKGYTDSGYEDRHFIYMSDIRDPGMNCFSGIILEIIRMRLGICGFKIRSGKKI